MNRIHLLIPILLISAVSQAQVPEDAIRYSFYPQNGTARSMAIGGTMTSLGGDITALYTNPAGLGFFKTGEYMMSPGFALNNNKANYRGNLTKGKHNAFNFGPTGFVLGGPSGYKKNSSNAVSIAISQTADFTNTISYNALNNYSSFTEQWAEQVAKSRLTIDKALNNPAFAFGAAPALYTYLVDVDSSGAVPVIKGKPSARK
jgi:hypothetical protein